MGARRFDAAHVRNTNDENAQFIILTTINKKRYRLLVASRLIGFPLRACARVRPWGGREGGPGCWDGIGVGGARREILPICGVRCTIPRSVL